MEKLVGMTEYFMSFKFDFLLERFRSVVNYPIKGLTKLAHGSSRQTCYCVNLERTRFSRRRRIFPFTFQNKNDGVAMKILNIAL